MKKTCKGCAYLFTEKGDSKGDDRSSLSATIKEREIIAPMYGSRRDQNRNEKLTALEYLCKKGKEIDKDKLEKKINCRLFYKFSSDLSNAKVEAIDGLVAIKIRNMGFILTALISIGVALITTIITTKWFPSP